MPKPLTFDHRFFERYRYLIVDAAYRDEIPASWKANAIAPAFLGKDTQRCPRLIDTDGLPEADLGSLMDRLEAECVAGQACLLSLGVATNGTAGALLNHLRQRIQLTDPADRRPKQFRYFDPGTFIQLPELLGDIGMAWLLGPIQSVAVPWLGEWRAYDRAAHPQAAAFDIQRYWETLRTIGIINRVLTRLELADPQAWCAAAARTRQHVERARTHHRLELRDDLVQFALHAWQWHPEFDRHPAIQKLLGELAAATPEDELDYRELAARLDESEWARIANELNATQPQQGSKQ